MKNLRSKQNKELIAELMKVMKEKRRLELREKFLKEYFKAQMKNFDCAKVENWIITLTDRIRTTLDREKLALELGEKLQKYEKTTNYKQFDIKQIKKESS